MGDNDKDRRTEFIQEYTLKSMRLKVDKWNKIIISDVQRQYLQDFLDKDLPQSMVISQNIAGHLQIHVDWPSALRNKGVYFVKRDKEPIPNNEDTDMCDYITLGDIYPNALDHFCSLVDEVRTSRLSTPCYFIFSR